MRTPISSKELQKLFDGAMKEDMPEIWWCLRNGQWPDCFGEERLYAPDQAQGIIDQIPRIVGTKACYRHSATHHGDMNDQMFDDWWDSAESYFYKVKEPVDPVPKWLGEERRADRGEDRYVPAMLAILLAQLLLFLLQLFNVIQVV